MPKYACEVKNAKGEINKIELEASSMQALASLISDRGYYLVKATEVKTSSFSFSLGKRISNKDLMVFTVQLSTLVGAAIPLVEAVGVLADQTENPRFKDILLRVSKDLQSGQPFSASLRKHPGVFNKIYCNMCEAGEAGGMLDTVLQRLAAFAEADSKMRGKIKSAMTMPVVQLVLAFLCVIFLLVKIFPNFTEMFKKMKAELPPLTKTLIFLSDLLRENLILCLGGSALFVVLIIAILKTEAGQTMLAKVSLSFPVIGPLTKKVAVSRFARTFCSLLAAGVPILNALKITASVMGNPIFEAKIESMAIKVQQGNTLGSTLKGDTVFPPMVQKMVEIGESSGNLDKMLEKAADFYDQEVAESLDGLTAALTPILTVFMGALIGTIALSVFQPLFSLTQQMK